MDASELIDGLIDDRVVVFGSLPPAGRDIDIVARAAQLQMIERGLRSNGFTTIAGSLVRFRDCGAEAVELIPISDWALPSQASHDLFDHAIPLEGRTNLCRPAPEHAILIAARRLMRERAGPGKAASYFAAALEEQPDAIAPALEQAPAWRVKPAVKALREGHARLGLVPRVLGLTAVRRGQGFGLFGSLGWAVRRQAPPRPRRGALIALSGLDGSGKSTQAAALADTLRQLGFDARVEWVSMATPRWLSSIVSALKAALRPIFALRARKAGSSAPELDTRNPVLVRAGPDVVRDTILVSPGMTRIWSSVIALRLAVRTGVVLRSAIWRGQVVVCDRYVLDAWTYMRYHFPAAPSLRLQMALLELLSPRPLRAFALIIRPEMATRRKPDFDAVENARRVAYYEECIDRLGVNPIDGELPSAVICARIASEVCSGLSPELNLG